MLGKIYVKSSEKIGEVADKSVDLVVTHPPFLGSSWKCHKDLYNASFSEIDRVVKDNAVVAVVNTDVIKNGVYAKHIDIHNWFVKENGYRLYDEKIWLRNKRSSLFRKSLSYIQFFTKGNPQFNKSSHLVDDYYNEVWFIRDSMNRKWFKDAFHPQIPKIIISVFSHEGDVVLDPFCGVGTTINEALKLNRNAIGYENDKELVPLIKVYTPNADIV